ncbi:MAG TPA: DUF3307 domain-containing protein [Rhizomicrobium sp.]|nr:DUF3307 domain-containing protein [Rhizomicrobium sp.]
MNQEVMLVLLALTVFQFKHFLCDFALQTPFQIDNKRYYGHIGGIIHSGLHALFSIPALFILTRSPQTILILIVAEFLIHYHADFFKARIDQHYFLTGKTSSYWVIFGLDQLIHQLTYLAMVVAVLHGI